MGRVVLLTSSLCSASSLGDSRHIGRSPCEDVSVVPKEVGECEFLFGVEVGPDDDFLGCVGQAEANLFDGWTWVQSRACTLLF
jgi:hypothetical protein